MSAKDFYKTMWNPLYEGTDHKQFSYNELIEFAEEYAEHKLASDGDLANVSVCDCQGIFSTFELDDGTICCCACEEPIQHKR